MTTIYTSRQLIIVILPSGLGTISIHYGPASGNKPEPSFLVAQFTKKSDTGLVTGGGCASTELDHQTGLACQVAVSWSFLGDALLVAELLASAMLSPSVTVRLLGSPGRLELSMQTASSELSGLGKPCQHMSACPIRVLSKRSAPPANPTPCPKPGAAVGPCLHPIDRWPWL